MPAVSCSILPDQNRGASPDGERTQDYLVVLDRGIGRQMSHLEEDVAKEERHRHMTLLV